MRMSCKLISDPHVSPPAMAIFIASAEVSHQVFLLWFPAQLATPCAYGGGGARRGLVAHISLVTTDRTRFGSTELE